MCMSTLSNRSACAPKSWELVWSHVGTIVKQKTSSKTIQITLKNIRHETHKMNNVTIFTIAHEEFPKCDYFSFCAHPPNEGGVGASQANHVLQKKMQIQQSQKVKRQMSTMNVTKNSLFAGLLRTTTQYNLHGNSPMGSRQCRKSVADGSAKILRK